MIPLLAGNRFNPFLGSEASDSYSMCSIVLEHIDVVHPDFAFS